MIRARLAASLRVPPFPARSDPLLGLDDVPWSALKTGFGAPATEVPAVLRALRADGPATVVIHGMDCTPGEALGAVVMHQGTLGTATAPAARFVVRLVADGGLPHAVRAELLAWLAIVANQAGTWGPWSEPGPEDSDRLQIARSVCDALAAEVPSFFAEREREPAGVRFCLALLAAAALDGNEFGELLGEVERLAAEYVGTGHGAALSLAAAVMRRDDDAADELADDVAAIIDVATDDLFEDDEVTPAFRARFLLGEAIIQLAPE